jgi:hypothetical protein
MHGSCMRSISSIAKMRRRGTLMHLQRQRKLLLLLLMHTRARRALSLLPALPLRSCTLEPLCTPPPPKSVGKGLHLFCCSLGERFAPLLLLSLGKVCTSFVALLHIRSRPSNSPRARSRALDTFPCLPHERMRALLNFFAPSRALTRAALLGCLVLSYSCLVLLTLLCWPALCVCVCVCNNRK